MLKKLFLFFFLWPVVLTAQVFPDKPFNYVTDEGGILSAEEQSALNSKCKSFENSTTNQVFVYIASDLKGNDMTSLCQEIFNKWEIGQEGRDNGVLVAVFVNDKQFRIHTGYGLEGSLPDLLTKKIQDETMRPYFKTQDYFTGLSKGIDEIIEYSAHEYEPETTSTGKLILAITIIIVFCYLLNAVFLWAIRSTIKSDTKKSERTKKVFNTLAWIFFCIPFAGTFLLFFLFIPFASFKGGGGGGSSRSWGSSGGSSFGGGGGGRSGGGGSSSSW